MNGFAAPVADLIEQLGKLPGIGPKSAQRLAFHIIARGGSDIDDLIHALAQVKKGLTVCAQCFVIADRSPCSVCADVERDHSTICVVQDTRDVLALERMGAFHGVYHVLGGVISPMDGIGPDDLRIAELLSRLQPGGVAEVIVATSSTVEGEATAMYVHRLLQTASPVRITRIAHGLPIGGDLEFADDVTLARALEFRRPM
ncbi:MAG: recombination mediator RecR [Firmicutes bacterium]|nr:recombination mediator RecR [Bacillota bacterium]